MIIRTLVENTSISDELKSEHGLSLYIETEKHKILFDTGKSDLFAENAEKMGVSLADIDLAVISHGHYDHGGGIKTFFEKNKKAKLYVHRNAFEKHLAKRPDGSIEYIGLDEELKDNDRFIFTDDYLKIDDELELFSGVKGKELCSISNKVLLHDINGDVSEDTFCHEQNLIITQGDKMLLIAGCAHNGIVNIVKRFEEIKGTAADFVIGGFHLSNPSSNQSEAPELISEIAERLVETKSMYYTCHCTGLTAYSKLKEIMKDRVCYLATGSEIRI